MLKRGDITIEDSERQPCEIWDRIVGYYRPVTIDAYKTSGWNPGQLGYYFDRIRYGEEKSMRVLPDYEQDMPISASEPAQISIISPPGIPAVISEL